VTVTAAEFHDRFGDREYARPSLVNFVSEMLHRGELTVASGRVLEVGAGVGRFSVLLAKRCSSMVVVDVSLAQLERNRSVLHERALLEKVERHLQADVCALCDVPDEAFDSVVCFRGPLNYSVFSFDAALDELFRVLRPGGILFISVRTVQSGVRPLVQAAFQTGDPEWLGAALRLIGTSVLEHPTSPTMRLFSVTEILALIEAHGGRVERLSGDGFLAPWLDWSAPRMLWTKFARIEKRLARDPYGIAHANHVILTIRKVQREARRPELDH
jgi:ubiquinone/menaquinone biosynthesis C-methylase UbiE